jgi:hypothetical protein
MGIVDWWKRGKQATRWREYLFLIGITGVVMGYGVVNDQVTSAISWEYFYYGKGLDGVLGERVPPEGWALHWEAGKVGLKATWSAGLVVGVGLLIANNPWRGRRRLGYRELWGRVPMMLGVTAVVAVVFGVLGYAGVFAWWSEDFRQMLARDEFRPRRFMMVFGIHLGGYVGGLVGMLVAAGSIVWERRRLNHEGH